MELKQQVNCVVHHVVHTLASESYRTTFSVSELVKGDEFFTGEEVQVDLLDICVRVKLGMHPSTERRVGYHVFRSKGSLVMRDFHNRPR